MIFLGSVLWSKMSSDCGSITIYRPGGSCFSCPFTHKLNKNCWCSLTRNYSSTARWRLCSEHMIQVQAPVQAAHRATPYSRCMWQWIKTRWLQGQLHIHKPIDSILSNILNHSWFCFNCQNSEVSTHPALPGTGQHQVRPTLCRVNLKAAGLD